MDKTRREVAEVEHQAEAFRRNLENWFNDAMNRVGRLVQAVDTAGAAHPGDTAGPGRERRYSDARSAAFSQQRPTRITGRGCRGCGKNPAAPGAAEPKSSAPESDTKTGEAKRDETSIQYVLQKTQSLQLPVGWSLDPKDPRYFRLPEFSLDFAGWAFYKIFGLLVSILAVSMGAPFWFDTLSKFVNLRSAGTPPGETRKARPSPDPLAGASNIASELALAAV